MPMKDFDAFWAEAQPQKGHEFKLFGETYELPASMPASVVLRFTRLHRELGPNAALPAAEAYELAYDIFGHEHVDAWCAKGLTDIQLQDLLAWAADVYNSDLGNRRSPAKRRRAKDSTSSRNGRSLRRTSGASTASG